MVGEQEQHALRAVPPVRRGAFCATLIRLSTVA